MSGPISKEENELVSNLKKEGRLLRFAADELKGVTKNGGVAIVCSDGDIDASVFHRQISHRPHEFKLFGGPLLFARSFGGFREAFVVGLLENLRQGMDEKVKNTKTLFLYFHAPCGMALAHNHGIEDVLEFAPEARDFFASDNFFVPAKIHLLFHVKRINKAGALEQNTYKIAI